MIKSIYDGITKALKNAFPDKAVFEVPVRTGYKNGDFLLKVNSCINAPRIGGYYTNTVGFVIECYSEKEIELSDIIIELINAIELIELENGIVLRADIEKNQINDACLKIEFKYSFYSYIVKGGELMKELEYDIK